MTTNVTGAGEKRGGGRRRKGREKGTFHFVAERTQKCGGFFHGIFLVEAHRRMHPDL